MHTLTVPTDESVAAAQIMAGSVTIGHYGTMTLAANPTWKTQSTLDLAGNRYVHSLNWALPLLREGTRNTPTAAAYTARFVYLLKDWVKDHPVASRTALMNQPQYGGFRLGTWVCAHRLLTDPAQKAWVATQAKVDLAVQLKAFTLTGANNTMMNSQLAAYAAAEEVGTAKQRSTALANINALRPVLINADGSDKEGAPAYGGYYTQILVRTERVLSAYKAAAAAAAVRADIAAQGSFQAQATRPDRKFESIGDSPLSKITAGVFPGTSDATWVRTSGAKGTVPASTYSRWTGGYVFGRSGWVAGVDETSSFYSLRTSTQALAAPHRHVDTTGVTFFSHGVSWIGDPGPYQYDSSALRAFIGTRDAHSALIPPSTVTGATKAVLLSAKPSAAADKTCVRDLTYQKSSGIVLTRCVYYLRTIDALVVQDVVTSPTTATTIKQQWLLPPQVNSAVAEASGGALLTGTTAAGTSESARLLTDSTVGATSITPAGAVLGQFGTTYGVHTPGQVVSLSIPVPAGTTQTALTVIAAGTDPLSIQHETPATVGAVAPLTVSVGTRTQTFKPAF